MKKRYLYKIYDDAGAFLRTWGDVVSEPQFTADINGAFSELTVKVARNVFDFGENTDIKYGNRLKLYVFDGDSGQNGTLIFSGFISRYEPVIDGGQMTIEVTFASWYWELARFLLEGTGSGIDSSIYGDGYSNDITATMTTNTAPSPNVASASSEYSASYQAWQAFDKNIDNATRYDWATAAAQPNAWLKFDFGAGNTKTVKKYTIIGVAKGGYSSRNGAPKDWVLQGSNDNTNWTDLDSQENQQDWGELEKRSFEVDNDTAYRYYRLNISANNEASGTGIFRLAELELMEGVAYARAGATAVKYLSQDPSDILKDVLDKFTAAGGLLSYDGASVDDTGTVVSYQFNTNTVQEALTKVIELCPEDWYFRIGADDKVYLKEKAATVAHKFHIGRSITYYRQEKRLENLVNYIYFKGKTFFKKYVNTSSESTYGRYSKKIVDERVTKVSTADTMANAILNKMATPEIRITVKVIDNNANPEKGYDIESIKPGDTCQIFNATQKGSNLWDQSIFDSDAWDYDITNSAGIALQIQKVEYHPDYALLEISNLQPNVAKRIEDINRNLVASQTASNPVQPLT